MTNRQAIALWVLLGGVCYTALLALLDTRLPSTRHVAGLGILVIIAWTRGWLLWQRSPHDPPHSR